MRVTLFRTLVALLLACMATAAAAGNIVFTHPHFDATGTLTRSSLSVAWSDGTAIRTVTAAADGVIDNGATWSPDGTRFAFEHAASRTGLPEHFDILSYDMRTRQIRRMTSGSGNFVAAAWGPRNRIAFVSRYRSSNCLSVIEANGRQHDLFCPPAPAELRRPTWSADGTRLFIQAGYSIGGVDQFWRSLAYRVDAGSGAASVVDDRVLEEKMPLEFSPDGSHGIFYNQYPYTSGMTLVNFATHATRSIASGYAPRWSQDGRRIAFTSEVYEVNPPNVRYYESLFVMRADGTQVCRVTQARANDHAYTAVDWSSDGVHVLVNRRLYLDPSLTVPRYALRIVNVDTGALKVLPDGYAEPGAWRER